MTEDQRTYYTDAPPSEFDHITALVVPVHADKFVPYTGEQVLVAVDSAWPSVSAFPAMQAARIVQVVKVHGGSMLSFADPIVIPHAPRLPHFTVCDLTGAAIR